MARPERFELPTARFVAEYSIQLSYGRIVWFLIEQAVWPFRRAHIVLSRGASVKGKIPSINRAAGAAVPVRQCEELQLREIPFERTAGAVRLLLEPLYPALRLGHIVIVELLPEGQ